MARYLLVLGSRHLSATLVALLLTQGCGGDGKSAAVDAGSTTPDRDGGTKADANAGGNGSGGSTGNGSTGGESEGGVPDDAASMDGDASDGAPPRPVYTDNEDGTVTDSTTGLTWQQTVAPGGYLLADAKSYCAKLALAGGGWHLPSIKELKSIVDTTVDTSEGAATIDAFVFPDTPPEQTWSSTPYEGMGLIGYTWGVDFSTGVADGYAPAEAGISGTRVRCAR